MEFYDFFRFAVVAYCVIRALAAKKNPVFWGIFAFFIPWLAIVVIHFFTWKSNDTEKGTMSGNNRQEHWERIRQELQERNKRQQQRQQNYQSPTISKEPAYEVPPKKPSKNKPLQEYDIPVVDAIEIEPEVKDIEALKALAQKEIVVPTIEIPDFVASDKLHKWEEEEKEANLEEIIEAPESLALRPIETLEIAPLSLDDIKDADEAIEERGTTVPEIIPTEQPEDIYAEEEEPVQTQGCVVHSHTTSPSGMHKIKYSKQCSACEWDDKKQFSFLFHESINQKKDSFICPNCLEKNDLSILVSLKTKEDVLS